MDQSVAAALLGLVSAAVLGVGGYVGRRYEGRETRAMTAQGAVIDDLEHENARLRLERDEARADVAAARLETRELRDELNAVLRVRR